MEHEPNNRPPELSAEDLNRELGKMDEGLVKAATSDPGSARRAIARLNETTAHWVPGAKADKDDAQASWPAMDPYAENTSDPEG